MGMKSGLVEGSEGVFHFFGLCRLLYVIPHLVLNDQEQYQLAGNWRLDSVSQQAMT